MQSHDMIKDNIKYFNVRKTRLKKIKNKKNVSKKRNIPNESPKFSGISVEDSTVKNNVLTPKHFINNSYIRTNFFF